MVLGILILGIGIIVIFARLANTALRIRNEKLRQAAIRVRTQIASERFSGERVPEPDISENDEWPVL